MIYMFVKFPGKLTKTPQKTPQPYTNLFKVSGSVSSTSFLRSREKMLSQKHTFFPNWVIYLFLNILSDMECVH